MPPPWRSPYGDYQTRSGYGYNELSNYTCVQPVIEDLTPVTGKKPIGACSGHSEANIKVTNNPEKNRQTQSDTCQESDPVELGSTGAPPPCRQRHSGIWTPRIHLNSVTLARLRTAGRSGRPQQDQ